jgi:hypothetical protein
MEVNQMKRVPTAAVLFAFFALVAAPAAAATVTVTKAEVSVGLDYIIGFAATVERGAPTDSRTSPGSVGVVASASVSGFRPITGEPQSASVTGSASGSIAIGAVGGTVAPGFSGDLAGSLAFTADGSVAAAGGNAGSDVNFVDYEFVVSGGSVGYTLDYATDASSQITLRGSDVSPIVLSGLTTTRTGTLAADTYTLRTFHSFAATAPNAASGNTRFAMTFTEGTIVAVAPIPLPAGAWLLLGALAGIAGLARGRARPAEGAVDRR